MPISSTGTASAQFTPTAAGTYHWAASYSGDSVNNNSTTHNTACNDTAEDVVVSTVASSMTTAQRWVPRDSATISAPSGGALAGSVSFSLYASSDCGVAGSDAAIYSTTMSVAGASPQTVNTANASTQPASQGAGSYSWSVSYTSTNPAQRSIPASCQETSSLTIANGGTISSP